MVFWENTNLNSVILEVKHISKSFNGLNVLEDVSFSLTSGSITALFGENGSGKTTIFHLISSFLKADSGEILFKDMNISSLAPIRTAQLGIGRVWQTPRIFRNLTVLNNLLLAVRNHPGEKLLNYLIRPMAIKETEIRSKSRAEQVMDQLSLAGKLRFTAGSLSFGQQKLLSIGMLLMNEAELLIIDEPFAGVNSLMIDHISEVLLELKRQGRTICLIEHNRTKAEAISDRILTLAKGNVIEQEVLNA